jgi:hypothetical protein
MSADKLVVIGVLDRRLDIVEIGVCAREVVVHMRRRRSPSLVPTNARTVGNAALWLLSGVAAGLGLDAGDRRGLLREAISDT